MREPYSLERLVQGRAVAPAVAQGCDPRELGPEEDDLRGIVAPEQQRDDRTGGAVGRRDCRAGEVEGEDGLAQREEGRRDERPETHATPRAARVGKELEGESEEHAHGSGAERSAQCLEPGGRKTELAEALRAGEVARRAENEGAEQQEAG